MADLAKLGIQIESKQITKANRELTKFSKTSRKAANDNERNSKSARRLGASYKFMAGAVGGAVAAFLSIRAATALLGKFITNTIAAEDATTQLNAALKSTGGVAGLASEELQAMAAGLQSVTRFGDEAVVETQALLLTFTKIGGQIFPRALEAILDVSTAMKQDLKSSAIQVGKALNDPVLGMTALTRTGITFTDAQKEMVKALVKSGNVLAAQTLILKELETQFGGSARAARDTLGGALTALGNAWGDLFEVSKTGSEGVRLAVENLVKVISDPKFSEFVQMIGVKLFDALRFVAENAQTFVTVVGVGMVGAVTALTAALLLNPIGLFATAVGALGVAIFKVTKSAIEYNEAQVMVNKALSVGKNITGFLTDETLEGAKANVKAAEAVLLHLEAQKTQASWWNQVGALMTGVGVIGATDESIDKARANLAKLRQDLESTKVNARIGQAFDAPTATVRDPTVTLTKNTIEATHAWEGLTKAVEQSRAAVKFARDVTGGFISDMRSGLKQGESFWDSFKNAALSAIDKITDKLINELLDAVFKVGKTGGSIFGFSGGGSSFSAFTNPANTAPIQFAAPAFASGGFTGGGAVNKVVGVTHGQEFVVNAPATRQNRGMLEAMNSGRNISADGNVFHAEFRINTIIDERGNIDAFVRSASNQQIQEASPKIVEAAVDGSGSAIATGKFKQPLSEYNLTRKTKAR